MTHCYRAVPDIVVALSASDKYAFVFVKYISNFFLIFSHQSEILSCRSEWKSIMNAEQLS